MEKYFFLNHTADIKIHVNGDNLNEIFDNSTLAISHYIFSGNVLKDKLQIKRIALKSDNLQNLLYLFLEELIYFLDAKGLAPIYSQTNIKNKEGEYELSSVISLTKILSNSLKDIKSPTYSEMYIKQTGKRFEAEFVLDV